VVEKAKAEVAKKKAKKKRIIGSRTLEIEFEVEEVIKNLYSDSDDDCT
jgi:hypothetical protein